MNIDEVINGWTFEETIKTAENLIEVEKDMFKWDVLRHLRDFAELYREKLKEYEDLEEQGLLLRLPVPIGTTVYNTTWWDDKYEIVTVNGKKYSRSVRKHKVTKSTFGLLDIKEWGKTVFLTQSEAEAKLKELRGEQNDGE